MTNLRPRKNYPTEARDETTRDAIATAIQVSRHTAATSYEIADDVIEVQTRRAAELNAKKQSDLSEKR